MTACIYFLALLLKKKSDEITSFYIMGINMLLLRLTQGVMTQDPQWITKTSDSIKPYIILFSYNIYL